ncbi:MAG: LamG domain-containing protein, partial [Alphaproteobacteria bacterium]|nr:LamG domain-containing protein [Alphaproteobacteria bacterium]
MSVFDGIINSAFMYRFDRSGGSGTVAATLQTLAIPSIHATMQARNDGKIYFNVSNEPGLSVITDPNNFSTPNILLNNYMYPSGVADLSLANDFKVWAEQILPTNIAGDDTTLCTEGPVDLGCSSCDSIGASYFWEPAAMVIHPNNKTTQTIGLSANQTFMVHVMYCGDTITTDTVQVSVIDPTITASAETICFGDSTALEVEDPISGYSLEFDGIDDYLDAGDVLDAGTESFTATTTVKFNDVNTGLSLYEMILANWYTGSGYGPGYTLRLDRDYPTPVIRASVSGSSWGIGSAISTTPINSGQYYNLTMVIDRSENFLKLYIDGVIADSIDISTAPVNLDNSDPLEIGRHTWPSGAISHFLNGFIDNFSFWNIALSQSEIQTYMNCPPTGNEAGLISYWNFEEGSGTTVFDQNANGNNGTINGAVYSTDVPVTCATNADITWSTADTTSSIWVTPGATTTFSVTVDDGIGSCTDDIEITVNDPQVDLGT